MSIKPLGLGIKGQRVSWSGRCVGSGRPRVVGLLMLTVLSACVAGGFAMVAGDWPTALPSPPAVDRESSSMGTVVSIESCAVLTLRVDGRQEVVALVGVVDVGAAGDVVGGGTVSSGRSGGAVGESDAAPAGSNSEHTAGSAGGTPGHWQGGRVFLEGLLIGEPVRVVVSRDRGWTTDAAGRRYVRLFREPDGLFVNAELIRQGYAAAADEPTTYAERSVFRMYERRAKEVGKGVWRAVVVEGVAGGEGESEAGGSSGSRRESARPAPSETREPETRPAPRGGGGKIVYVTRSGTRYHRADCRHVNSATGVERVGVTQARARGLEPCRVCSPDE